jgi:sugar phosphate permease
MGKRSLAIIFASFCTVFIGFAVRNSYGILLPEMIPSLMISKREAGVIYGSFFIAYTLFSPVLGFLADRINIRILLTLFSVILGIGTLLMGYASSMMEASFFFLLAGIGSSACWSPVVPLVQRWSSDRRRGVTLAIVDAGASFGIAVSSMMMPLIVGASNWRMGWKGLGTVAFFMAGINYLLVRNSPGEDQNSQHPKCIRQLNQPTNTIYLKILRDHNFLILGVSYLLIGFSTLIPLTFITSYAVQELMFRYTVASRLITTIAVASTVGKLVLSTLSDALGRIKTIILCDILVVIGIFGVVSFPSSIAMHFSMAIFGFGFGAIWTLQALCAADFFSENSAGFIVGFWTLFLGVGLVLSPIFAGWIADVTGVFRWSFMLAIATAITSMILLFLVEKKVTFPNVKTRLIKE